MTDEQKLEPDEQEEVEGHAALEAPLDRERADDEGDEVEGHIAFEPPDKASLS
jgi:hypothetical protein